MTKYEKETIINFNEDEDTATIYSCSQKIWNKCEKVGSKLIDTNLDSDGNIVSKTYATDKKQISLRKPRILSDEHKEKLRKRAKVMRTGSEDSENFPKDNIAEDAKKGGSFVF
jgi:hypothetical protein